MFSYITVNFVNFKFRLYDINNRIRKIQKFIIKYYN